jgi:hypothetical protein
MALAELVGSSRRSGSELHLLGYRVLSLTPKPCKLLQKKYLCGLTNAAGPKLMSFCRKQSENLSEERVDFIHENCKLPEILNS